MVSPMSRTILALLAASVVAGSVVAGAAEAAADGDPTDRQPTPSVQWRKPILYSLSGMGVGFVALVASRQGDEDPSLGNFVSAFSRGPRRDDDSALYNFVLHPLWGSETYLRAREAHMGMLGSFAFSLGASVTWEYLVESWTEHPSSQDLILTTGIGWMLGELRHRWKSRHPEDAAWVDPIHHSLQRFGVTFSGAGTKQPKLHLSYRF